MSHLQYRLFTGNDPQGKQKIYFCCHPDDLDGTFDRLCNEIFSREENCVIFYESDPCGTYDRDDLLFQLGDMQLFVVPVTEKLLNGGCRAMDLELPFALGRIPGHNGLLRHIAVLPILMDSSLVDRFNTTEPFCGLQFIDPNAKDPTGLSFDEKLNRYLRSVLISNIEADRIISEFKARIFLSYRKIDRARARRLMERIHRRNLCRDVSIWYDEYLIPGENWKTAIDQALAASDLFVLSVTDSLRAPDNYILNKEYPAALNSGKPILPVKTEPVDMSVLIGMYDRITENLTELDDDTALDAGLRRTLVDDAGKKELLTPDDRGEHLYYIGLAYKNSIGVESAPFMAVELLEQAGKNGYRRAYLTLGDMYRHGDGVDRDEDRAIGYYDEFIRLQTPDFGTSRQGDLDLVNAYDAKGMIYLGSSRLQQAFAVYEELNRLIEGMTSCFGSFKQLNLPTSYERLGNIKNAMGDPSAAQEYFKKALDSRLHPPVVRNIATEEDRKSDSDPKGYNEYHSKMGFAANLHSLGQIALQNRDLATARKNLLQSNRLFEELDRDHEDRDIKLSLCKSCLAVGSLCDAEGNPAEAGKYYEKALASVEPLCNNPQDLEAGQLHILVLASLSDWHRNNSRTDQAWTIICDALTEAESLTRIDRSPPSQSALAMALSRKATLADMRGDQEEARSCLEREIDIEEKLSVSAEDADHKRNLAIGYEKLARLISSDPERIAPEDYLLARNLLQKDLEITRSLAGDASNNQAQRDLSVCYDALYNLLRYREPEKALEYAVRGLMIAYRLAEEIRMPQEIYELGSSYFAIALLCADVRELCLQNAYSLWAMVYRVSGDKEIAKKMSAAQKLLQSPYANCPLGPGYCTGLQSLTDRWPEGNSSGKDYSDISRISFRRGSAASLSDASGCIMPIVFLLIIVAGILQLTGAVDITGLIRSKLGENGSKIVAAVLVGLSVFSVFSFRKKRQ